MKQKVDLSLNRWKIRGRVTFQSNPREFHGRNGLTELISFDIQDHTGEICVVASDLLSQHVQNHIEMGKVFLLCSSLGWRYNIFICMVYIWLRSTSMLIFVLIVHILSVECSMHLDDIGNYRLTNQFEDLKQSFNFSSFFHILHCVRSINDSLVSHERSCWKYRHRMCRNNRLLFNETKFDLLLT